LTLLAQPEASLQTDGHKRNSPEPAIPVLGLGANWRQFLLLVVVTGFVGAMVGLERAILPLLASREFGLVSASAVLSFIVTFGLTKALTNLASGWLASRLGRRRTLVIGWLLALPVPLIMLVAPSWSWIAAANALLGVSQGLTWSATVVMKIDLVGPARRGLAMGLNEFAGYVAVAGAAVLAAVLAGSLGLRQGPALLGVGIAAVGLLLSLLAVKDTTAHVAAEESALARSPSERTRLRTLLRDSLRRDARLFSASQAGLVNNLNDGLAWGLFPLMLAGAGAGLSKTGWLVALYPATWGLCQLGTGALSDRWRRKPLIVAGMVLQGLALIALAGAGSANEWAAGLVALGVGTALVYPTLLAAVGDSARPSSRAATVGVYRMWRDLGYAAGALLAGVLADSIGPSATIGAVGVLTIASGLGFALRYQESAAASPVRAGMFA
jgi:MFS family permease